MNKEIITMQLKANKMQRNKNK